MEERKILVDRIKNVYFKLENWDKKNPLLSLTEFKEERLILTLEFKEKYKRHDLKVLRQYAVDLEEECWLKSKGFKHYNANA